VLIAVQNAAAHRTANTAQACAWSGSLQPELSAAAAAAPLHMQMPPEMIKSQMKQQQQQQYSQQQHQQPQEGLPPYCAKAVDAWSMGVLLYLLVTGIYPFEDQSRPNNLAATILNVQAGRCRPLPAYISHGCRALISGLLCPDPAQRTRLEVRGQQKRGVLAARLLA
jgi:hypothetical protein